MWEIVLNTSSGLRIEKIACYKDLPANNES
jgi:hypothetical protein